MNRTTLAGCVSVPISGAFCTKRTTNSPHRRGLNVSLQFAFSINLLYLIASAYTLIWIAFKRCRKLSSHLTIYSKMCRERDTKTVTMEGGAAEEEMERKIDVFGGLNSPDVELLLDLLAETMGMAPAMRIMTMLDPELLKSWRVTRRTEVKPTAKFRS